MASTSPLVEEFQRLQSIAVVGVSRSAGKPGTLIYRKLKQSGRRVFPVNPSAAEIDGDRCYPDLRSLPEKVEGVIVATAPSVTEGVVDECVGLGIGHIWMHRSLGRGSVSPEAVAKARGKGIKVIDGGCPMMFYPPVDFPHRCLRFVVGLAGRLPK
jgi:uncharacterized protein